MAGFQITGNKVYVLLFVNTCWIKIPVIITMFLCAVSLATRYRMLQE